MSERQSIVAALSAVMNEVTVVQKKERNQAQNFSFRGIDAVMNAVGPALRKHGVVVLPNVLEHMYEPVLSANGKAMGHVIVKVEYNFYGPDGDCLSCTVIGESMDTGDKAAAKAMSVAFRTALLQSLTLPTDEADPDLDTYERAAPKAKQAKKVVEQHQDSDQVPMIVEAFNECACEDDLGIVAGQVAGLDISSAEKNLLREAYTAAKSRIEGK